MKRIVYKYQWKELTQEGLLKDPEDQGAYYESENVNGWDGSYDSEREAEEAFIRLKEKHPWCHHELVLIKITKVKDDE